MDSRLKTDDVRDLMHRAQAAGLRISRGPANRLIVTGPESAEALVKELIAHKKDVIDLICWPHDDFIKEQAQYGQRWICGRCHRFYGYRPRRPRPEDN